MLTKCNRLLAVVLAAGLTVTTFGSDFYCAKVWAADEETAETVQSEESAEISESSADESASEDQSYEESYDVEENNSEDTSYEEYTEDMEYSEEATEETTEEPSEEEMTEEEALEEELTEEELTEEELTEEELAALEALKAEKKAEEKKAEEYPAQSFSDSVAGMNVSVEAEEGAFPKGTTMRLSAISDSEAVSAAEDALDGEVKQAKGVDISFANAEGNEIEPEGAVRVSISLASALEGESFSVVHLDDNGNSEMVAGASNSGASFTADAFSVYIVAGLGYSEDDDDDQKAVATYNFYYNGNIFYTQLVKKGDELKNPGNPVAEGNFDEVFLGWFEQHEDGSYCYDPFTFGTIENVEAGATYNIYSRISTYDFQLGDNGKFSLTFNVVIGGENTEVTVTGKGYIKGKYTVSLLLNGQEQVVDADVCAIIREHIDQIINGSQATCVLIEYIIEISGRWETETETTTITYHINYGDEDITSTIEALTVNEAVEALDAAALNWTREGYRFLGWSKMAGDNSDAIFATVGALMAADNDGIPNDLYAVWAKNDDPVDPEDPEDPKPEIPVDPEDPEDPVDPADPTDPVTPADPEDPADPAPVAAVSSTNTTTTVETPAAPVVDTEAVLGERRTEDLPAVLGARRANTEDTTNVAGRAVSIIVALLAAAGLVVLGKKKEEE